MREHFTGSYDGVLWYIILKEKFMKIDKNFGIGFSCSFVSAFFGELVISGRDICSMAVICRR